MRFENDMLYLCLCALKNITPDVERIRNINLDELYNECKRHSVTALVCYALEGVVELPRKWSDAKGKAVRKAMLYDVERQNVTDFMNENGIRYLPLKGILLKEYYPQIGMREMSDNDIYYDIAHKDKLKEFMLSLGYTCTSESDDHDIYKKEPIYNFEFHHRLFLKEASQELCNYYSDIDKRMIRDSGGSFCHHLSCEDLYIYLIAHEYKHYLYCGTGIRSLLDCMVFLDKFEEALDWEYIKAQTQKAKIHEFELLQRSLCHKLLDSDTQSELDKKELELLMYMISSGVHGNFSTGVLNKARGKVMKDTRITFAMKAKYIQKRLFPPMSYYKRFYPFFYRHKWLVPLCFFYRLYLAAFKCERIKSEIEILNRQTNVENSGS